ncbi:MAG: hypothetical protein ACOVP1_11925 [Bacteroidia bacterium]
MNKKFAILSSLMGPILLNSCCEERTLYCNPGNDVIKSSIPYNGGETLVYQSESGKKIYVELSEKTGSNGFSYETNCKPMNKTTNCEPSVSIIGKVIDSLGVFNVYDRMFYASLTKRQFAETKEFYSFNAFGNRSSIWFNDNLSENKIAGLDPAFFVLETNFKTPFKQYNQVITYSTKELEKKEKSVFDTNGKLIAFISPNDAEWFYLNE